jgi:hypothetical protein
MLQSVDDHGSKSERLPGRFDTTIFTELTKPFHGSHGHTTASTSRGDTPVVANRRASACAGNSLVFFSRLKRSSSA